MDILLLAKIFEVSAKNPFGKLIETGKIVHISNVENGLECNCVCVECGEKLIAVNNKNNKRKIHFRHKIESDCKGGIETALHQFAKQIVAESNCIKISKDKTFQYDRVEIEEKLADYQPDVIIENSKNGEKWLIEIAVTHFVDDDKKVKIKRDNLKCLEIDLKNTKRNILPNDLRIEVLDNIENRKIIEKKWYESITLTNVLIVLVICWLSFGRKK